MLTKEELRNLIGAFHRAEYRINNSHDWNFLCSKSLTFFEFETQMKVGDIKIKDNPDQCKISHFIAQERSNKYIEFETQNGHKMQGLVSPKIQKYGITGAVLNATPMVSLIHTKGMLRLEPSYEYEWMLHTADEQIQSKNKLGNLVALLLLDFFKKPLLTLWEKQHYGSVSDFIEEVELSRGWHLDIYSKALIDQMIACWNDGAIELLFANDNIEWINEKTLEAYQDIKHIQQTEYWNKELPDIDDNDEEDNWF